MNKLIHLSVALILLPAVVLAGYGLNGGSPSRWWQCVSDHHHLITAAVIVLLLLTIRLFGETPDETGPQKPASRGKRRIWLTVTVQKQLRTIQVALRLRLSANDHGKGKSVS